MSQQEVLTIDINDLEKAAKVLSTYQATPLNKMGPGTPGNDEYETFKMAASLLASSDNYYLIKDIISKNFQASRILPETLGSFLLACFNENYGEDSEECGALCDPDDPNQSVSCRFQVWRQISTSGTNRIKKIGGNPKSKNAYVFVDSKFTGFTDQEKQSMTQKGVTEVHLLSTNSQKLSGLIPADNSKQPSKQPSKRSKKGNSRLRRREILHEKAIVKKNQKLVGQGQEQEQDIATGNSKYMMLLLLLIIIMAVGAVVIKGRLGR